MAKGYAFTEEAYRRTSAAVRAYERTPKGSVGATRKKIFPSSTEPARVRPTANAAGGGKYTGKVANRPTGTLAASGNLSATELGADGVDCLIYNAAEEGKATHDLTAGTPVQKTFIAVYLGQSNDATPKPVYMINGFDIKDC